VDIPDAFEHLLALLIFHVRNTLVAGDGFVRQQPYGDFSILSGDVQDVQVSRMDQVGAHSDVDGGVWFFRHSELNTQPYLVLAIAFFFMAKEVFLRLDADISSATSRLVPVTPDFA
jgi:hypothetical protein